MKIFYTISMLFLVVFSLFGCGKASSEGQDNVIDNPSPKINRTLYQENQEEIIAEYSSPIKSPTDERQTNLTIASNELNGSIVKPSETFSFCDTLGPATAEKGYKKAEVFTTKGGLTYGLRWWKMPS